MRLHRFAPLLILAGGTPAAAQTPSDVADLVGARGAGGESELQRRGYVFVRTRTGDDRKWSNWWNPARRQCLSIVTMDGRYASITATPAPDCDQRASAAGTDRPGGDYRPDIGYRPTAPQVGAPSYADRDLGRDDGDDADLGLVCFGDGQRPQAASSSGWTWNDRRGRYDYGSRTVLTEQHFDASLTLRFRNDTGRIRLPRKLVPPINSRGQDGWWDLDDVVFGRDTITAN